MISSKTFGKHLRMIRELRGLNQTELANRGGLQPSSIAHFEGGSRKPSFDNIGLLASALDISTDYLLGRTDEPAFSRTRDRLHQQISHLSASDRELGEDLIAMLVERNRKKKAREEKLLRDLRYRQIEQEAKKVLDDGKVKTLPVPVLDIVHQLGFGNMPVPDLEFHASGMLQRAGDLWVIYHDEPGRRDDFRNFAIAHELGHLRLDGHRGHLLSVDGIHLSQSGFFSADPYECEADHFAAHLLMPSDLLNDKLADLKEYSGLKVIETIASMCEVPLAAAAIRYAELTKDAAVIIISSGMAIIHCQLSKSMKAIEGVECPGRGGLVPASSKTAQVYSDPELYAGAKYLNKEANLGDWLGSGSEIPTREEVISLGPCGRVLTVLTGVEVNLEA